MVSAEKEISAPRANLGVSVCVRVGPPAARELSAGKQACGHVFRKPGVHSLNANVPDGVEVSPENLAAVVGRLEVAKRVRKLQHHSPLPIEHVLSAKSEKVRA